MVHSSTETSQRHWRRIHTAVSTVPSLSLGEPDTSATRHFGTTKSLSKFKTNHRWSCVSSELSWFEVSRLFLDHGTRVEVSRTTFFWCRSVLRSVPKCPRASWCRRSVLWPKCPVTVADASLPVADDMEIGVWHIPQARLSTGTVLRLPFSGHPPHMTSREDSALAWSLIVCRKTVPLTSNSRSCNARGLLHNSAVNAVHNIVPSLIVPFSKTGWVSPSVFWVLHLLFESHSRKSVNHLR